MIIFLNGASSSGKTTLVRALQSKWDSPLIYLSVDTVISQLPFQYTDTGSKADSGFPLSQSHDNGKLNTIIGIGEHGLRLNNLAASNARLTAESGYDLVIDYVLLSKEMLEPFRKELAQLEVYFIGVMCEEGELERRNEDRTDRPSGLSCAQQKSIHFCNDLYDFVIDSAKDSAEVLALSILQRLKQDKITIGIGCDN